MFGLTPQPPLHRMERGQGERTGRAHAYPAPPFPLPIGWGGGQGERPNAPAEEKSAPENNNFAYIIQLAASPPRRAGASAPYRGYGMPELMLGREYAVLL